MRLCSLFFVNLTCFQGEPQDHFKFSTVAKMSGMAKHVIKAGKVDPGDWVTLPMNFACIPELTLTRLLG